MTRSPGYPTTRPHPHAPRTLGKGAHVHLQQPKVLQRQPRPRHKPLLLLLLLLLTARRRASPGSRRSRKAL